MQNMKGYTTPLGFPPVLLHGLYVGVKINLLDYLVHILNNIESYNHCLLVGTVIKRHRLC